MTSKEPELPQELLTWNRMTPEERLAVMQKIQYSKYTAITFRRCLEWIKAHQL